MDTDFNLQTYLSEMRQEQRDDHNSLSEKLDGAVAEFRAEISKHHTRLVIVEGTRRVVLWLGGSAILALLGVLADLVVNHLIR